MNLKTDSNCKESMYGEIKRHEEQVAGVTGNINDHSDPFHETARNMVAGAEILINMINGMLSAGKHATKRADQFMKKIVIPRSTFL